MTPAPHGAVAARQTGGRRLRSMSGDLEPAGSVEYLPGRSRWAAIVVFAAVTTAGVVRLNPSAAAAAAGAVVAVGAAALLVLGWRPVLLYAAVATAGIAVLGNGVSSNIGWFTVCLLAGFCVLAGTRREGLAYWAGAMLLFAAEWLWGQPDPGWGAWLAGTTLTVAFSLLIFFPSFLLGSGGPPPHVMGSAVRQVAGPLPLTLLTNAVRAPWLGLGPATGSLIGVAALAVTASVLAARRTIL